MPSYFLHITGLYMSEMYATARGLLGNFASLVKERGYIPNSGYIECAIYFRIKKNIKIN